MKKSELRQIIKEEIKKTLEGFQGEGDETDNESGFRGGNIPIKNGKSLLDTSKYIEPKDMEYTLEKIYHILSGNVRDYISIPNIESVIKVLKQYDKTQYSKSEISESKKIQTQQEMKILMSDILESNKKVKQLMKQKGYEI
jgi:hypothetical protein